ncbi:hypothetical protein CVT25_005315 [Psilocybe cyanescens]|uniref:Uncharacterized protein n=1 Tax=Psilocybe cyanescens TaxID=93625 RepID=A0A409VPX2_PSICY|nr:hypothetical protein CVT25_005315 [Psilocybe cyanescens]
MSATAPTSSSSQSSSSSASSSSSTTSSPPGFSVPPQHTFSGEPSAAPTFPGNGNQNNSNGGSIATSASLYLYTFLATLVLLLSVSAAIVIRSFVLRRRHRLMVEEAIRNGTWVPPSPPSRPVKVDLSKKPMLWEAYIDAKGDIVEYSAHGTSGTGSRKINDAWRAEHSKEWDTIKPIAVTYLASSALPSVPAPPIGLATIPSVGSLRSASAAQQPPSPVGPQSDVEAAVGTPVNPSAAATVTATPPTSVRTRTPRHRAFLSRVGHLLNPTPNPTSPLPGPLTRSNTGSNANLPASAEDGNLNEKLDLQGPQTMRVAVLIAMPSPPTSSSASSSTVLSTPPLSSTSVPGPSSSPSPHTIPHPLNASAPIIDSDDEQPLPHLEVGVADVVVMPPDHVGVGDTHVGKRKAAQRGSLASMATGSEGSEV